jgi:hypothetical protein
VLVDVRVRVWRRAPVGVLVFRRADTAFLAALMLTLIPLRVVAA